MKTHRKLMSLLVLWTVTMSIAYANRLDGVWSTRDNRISVQIQNVDNGIRLNVGNNGWVAYRRQGNRYQSSYGSFCRIIDNQTLEWYDRRSRDRYTLYRQYNNRGNNDQYRDDRYNGDARNRYNFSRIEGRWYNESTGQQIQVKPRRDGLRVKFRGERWVTFRPLRNGVFQDGYGNQWILNRNTMEFVSFNRDFKMVFTQGDYRGRRHDFYFRF